MRRIGVLMSSTETDAEELLSISSLVQQLKALGWSEGRNIQIDYRWARGDENRAKSYAAELVALAPDAIFVQSAAMLKALQQATHSVPVVFVRVSDPVGGGFVGNLARPGGNITGFTQFEYTVAPKWLEILKQIAPRVTNVEVIQNPLNPLNLSYVEQLEAASATYGVKVFKASPSNLSELEQIVSAFAHERDGGLIALPSPTVLIYRTELANLAAAHRVPAVYPFRASVLAGGLVSYGIDLNHQFAEAASYIDRILKGEKPGDLPIQQPTKFQLVINQKAATALGLNVPPQLLAIADEVIE